LSKSGRVRLLEQLHSAIVGQCNWVRSWQSYILGLHCSLAMKLVAKGEVYPFVQLI